MDVTEPNRGGNSRFSGNKKRVEGQNFNYVESVCVVYMSTG